MLGLKAGHSGWEELRHEVFWRQLWEPQRHQLEDTWDGTGEEISFNSRLERILQETCALEMIADNAVCLPNVIHSEGHGTCKVSLPPKQSESYQASRTNFQFARNIEKRVNTRKKQLTFRRWDICHNNWHNFLKSQRRSFQKVHRQCKETLLIFVC